MRLVMARPQAANVLATLLVTFLVLFPKGGIKAAGAPITWGYLLLGLAFVSLVPVRLLSGALRLPAIAASVIASMVPFYLLIVFIFLTLGVDSAPMTASILSSFVLLPILFLLVFPTFFHRVDAALFKRTFRFCVLAAALWGIFLFFYHPIAGKYIEIPYLTVNAADYGQLESTKHIDRGGQLKLISTYNNGNVYGIATLILLPIFFRLEPRLWKRNIVRVALLLTLSRTVWAGLILEQAFSFFGQLPNLLARFPRLRPGPALNQAVTLAATVALVLVGTFLYSSGLNFIFDKGLSGRGGEYYAFAHPSLLPTQGLGGFDEVLYGSALREYGVAGCLGILLIFFFPFFLLAANPRLLRAPIQRAAAKGVVLYAFIAFIDGATNLIPVMCFYWFAYSTMLFGLPGDPPLHSISGTATQPLPTDSPPATALPPPDLGLLHS